VITYFGIARADGIVTSPVGVTGEGYPIYERAVPQGFFVVVEGKPGPDLRPVATSTFNWLPGDPNLLPDFMIVASRLLGNGSSLVCDDGSSGPPGGVPAIHPASFGGSQASANAINDLACRFSARSNAADACTRDFSALSVFVDSSTTVQFCPRVGIGSELAFPVGDTELTVRLRNTQGQVGFASTIVVRVLQ
jgi:hypothetical protein